MYSLLCFLSLEYHAIYMFFSIIMSNYALIQVFFSIRTHLPPNNDGSMRVKKVSLLYFAPATRIIVFQFFHSHVNRIPVLAAYNNSAASGNAFG